MSRDDFIRRRREQTKKKRGRSQVSQYSPVNERQLQAEKVMQDNAHQTAILSRILRKHKHLHQNDFDRIFGDTYMKDNVIYRKKIRFPFVGFHGYLLGDALGGEWSKWLDLLKIMVLGNVVKRQGKHPNLIYKLRGSN